MLTFAVQRTVRAVLTVLAVLTIAFFLVRLAGDPVALLVPVEASKEDIARIRTELGFNEPIFVQFVTFIVHAVQGDFGNSLRQQTPALGLVLERLPATLELAFTAFFLGIALAFIGGIWIQLSSSKRLRATLMWAAYTRQAIPVFFFGLLMILVFSVILGWFPSLGRGGWQHLVLPALTLATYELALYLRLFNNAFAEEGSQDYVRTAYAKGQNRAGVILRHMLPNALLPIVTIAGINLGVLLGGTVVTEIVFSWPGVGRLIVQAVSQRDYPVVQAGLLVVSTIFIVVNLLVDLLYAVLDPRVRLS